MLQLMFLFQLLMTVADDVLSRFLTDKVNWNVTLTPSVKFLPLSEWSTGYITLAFQIFGAKGSFNWCNNQNTHPPALSLPFPQISGGCHVSSDRCRYVEPIKNPRWRLILVLLTCWSDAQQHWHSVLPPGGLQSLDVLLSVFWNMLLFTHPPPPEVF